MSRIAGFDLPLGLLLAFRALVDEASTKLGEQGHGEIQPLHAFVLRSIGVNGTTAGALAAELAISKQAAAKTLAGLERQGYVRRAPDPADARRKLVRLTGKGVDCLARAAQAYDDLRNRWARELGPDRLRALEQDLAAIAATADGRIEAPGWFGGA